MQDDAFPAFMSLLCTIGHSTPNTATKSGGSCTGSCHYQPPPPLLEPLAHQNALPKAQHEPLTGVTRWSKISPPPLHPLCPAALNDASPPLPRRLLHASPVTRSLTLQDPARPPPSPRKRRACHVAQQHVLATLTSPPYLLPTRLCH
jgi:hypothetical protein